jgi:hypothetical protein
MRGVRRGRHLAAINRDDIDDIVVPLDEVAPVLCKMVGGPPQMYPRT